MGKLIEFKDVVKKFNGVPVLDGVTFGVEKGEVLCVVGPSGTGKSVTLKHLVRSPRLPDRFWWTALTSLRAATRSS